MWKLTIEDDEGKQTTLPLAHDEYALGRAEASSIRLTDRNISRKHAMLVNTDQGWLVRDLDSYNGTYVNGVRVAGEQSLRHGDLIQLGDYRLELLDEALITAPQPTVEGRGTTLSPLHTRPDRLVMIVGPSPGQEFPLQGERLSIGRSEECPISINHSSVSRHHAELLMIDKGRYEVIDQSSANGIRINGVELKRGLLEAGDALELGDVRLRFVGAGKIFRPVDTSLLNPMVTPGANGANGADAGRGRGGAWKIALGLLLVLLVAGFAVYGLTTSTDPSQGKEVGGLPEVKPDAQDKIILQQAQDAAGRNELEKAHELLGQMPETSSVRQDPKFKDIERRWAEWIMNKAQDKNLSPTERFDLLGRVASAPTVEPELRDQAIAQMAEVRKQSPELPPVPTRLPRGDSPGSPTPYTPPQPTPGPAPTPSTPTKVPAESTAGALEASGYAAQRKALEPKVWGGKASIDEIRMLRAICSHLGDRACRDRASAMLKQKESGGP